MFPGPLLFVVSLISPFFPFEFGFRTEIGGPCHDLAARPTIPSFGRLMPLCLIKGDQRAARDEMWIPLGDKLLGFFGLHVVR